MDKTTAAIRLFDAHARDYEKQFMDVGPYQGPLDAFCAAIGPHAAEVLELACGPGNITKYLLGKRPDLRILATDLSPNMLERALANNPQITVQCLDCRAVATLGRRFDAIVCGFALPYLNPEETARLIQDMAFMLEPNGVLYLSTMEGDPAQSGWRSPASTPGMQVHMQFHEADFLTSTLRANGCSLIHLDRTQTSSADGTVFTDLMFVAQKDGPTRIDEQH